MWNQHTRQETHWKNWHIERKTFKENNLKDGYIEKRPLILLVGHYRLRLRNTVKDDSTIGKSGAHPIKEISSLTNFFLNFFNRASFKIMLVI